MLGKHTSKQIIGTKSEVLKGKKIVLCITGSVAAMECPIIARELMRDGAEVYAVMSPAATKLISPDLMEWATGNPAVTELTGKVEHISLAGDHPDSASLVLVAPATANTISKIAHGIDDTPPTTVVSSAMGAGIPIVIVPAMHESMFRHPIILENINRLRSLGIEFVGPRFEEGKAKIAHIDTIVAYVVEVLTRPKDMKGLRVLITACLTREFFDSVRFISNPSSGKMGFAIARAAEQRGGDVILITGPTGLPDPNGVTVVRVGTAREMALAVFGHMEDSEIIIKTAAVSDYSPKNQAGQKIKKQKDELVLLLEKTQDILKEVGRRKKDRIIVGFAAETENLEQYAGKKLVEKNLDIVVGNLVGRSSSGFGTDTNEVTMFYKDGTKEVFPEMQKDDVAHILLDRILKKV